MNIYSIQNDAVLFFVFFFLKKKMNSNDVVYLSLKRSRFGIGGRLTGLSTFGSGRFRNLVNRLTDRLPNQPVFG
jgi:hypothetical protein